MSKTVHESIFTCDDLVIPMADVQHIEKHKDDDGFWLMIITKHTKYNFEHDAWENGIYVPARLARRFLDAWCYYRNELELDTLSVDH